LRTFREVLRVAERRWKSQIGAAVITWQGNGIRYTMSTSEEYGESITSRPNEWELVGERRVPKWVEMDTTGGAGPDMHVRAEIRGGSPEVVELGWKVRPGEREIRQKDLRGIDITKLAIDLYADCFQERHPFPKGPDGEFPTDEQLDEWAAKVRKSRQAARNFVDRQRRPREHRAINDDLLRSVAEVYRANVNKRAPTQAVAKHFGVGNRMASTYVQKARERGLLPPTIRGKKNA
jgi:hypothetical protein